MGSRLPIAVAVAALAASLAAPSLSAATGADTGLATSHPAPAAEPETGGVSAVTLKATSSTTPQPLASASGASAVTIRDFSFNPNGITVHAGGTVTWTNDGSTAHTATGEGFDSGHIQPGKSYSHTFSSSGTFNYVCQIHPFMKGKITVLASSSSSGSAPAPKSGATGPSGSSGAGSSTTPSSRSSAPSPSSSAGSSGSLPMTGSALWLLALAGLELAACGAVLRRLIKASY